MRKPFACLLFCFGAWLCVCLNSITEAAPRLPAITFENPTTVGDPATVFANRVYREAFRRLGLDYQAQPYPAARGILLAEQGKLDGLVHRAAMFGQEHPQLIRVDEPLTSIRIAVYARDPSPRFQAWEDLRGRPYRVDYSRDVIFIARRLAKVLGPGVPQAVNSEESGLKKLAAGRTDLFVGIEGLVQRVLRKEEFSGKGIAQAGVLQELELYPYLNARHRELAPKLAETMREMKREGLFQRYRAELGQEP